jgi:hypothetical protein
MPRRPGTAGVSQETAPSRRILVVEDDPEIADVERSILATEGFEVDIARDGGEALERLAVTRYTGSGWTRTSPGWTATRWRRAFALCRSTRLPQSRWSPRPWSPTPATAASSWASPSSSQNPSSRQRFAPSSRTSPSRPSSTRPRWGPQPRAQAPPGPLSRFAGAIRRRRTRPRPGKAPRSTPRTPAGSFRSRRRSPPRATGQWPSPRGFRR